MHWFFGLAAVVIVVVFFYLDYRWKQWIAEKRAARRDDLR